MPNKLPAILAAVATFILLLAGGFLLFFVQIIALNGVMSESKAFTSLGIGVLCQGISMILAAGLAGWLANRLIARSGWNNVLAVIIAVISGVVLGSIMAFVSTVISIPFAGIQ